MWKDKHFLSGVQKTRKFRLCKNKKHQDKKIKW